MMAPVLPTDARQSPMRCASFNAITTTVRGKREGGIAEFRADGTLHWTPCFGRHISALSITRATLAILQCSDAPVPVARTGVSHVSATGRDELTVTVTQLEEQAAWLRAHGATLVMLQRMIDLIKAA